MEFSDNIYKGPITESQHKVPRKYLRAWENEDGKVFTIRKSGDCFPSAVEKIEASNYFYEFQYLNVHEASVLIDWARKLLPKSLCDIQLQASLGSALLYHFMVGKLEAHADWTEYIQMLRGKGVFEPGFIEALSCVCLSRKLNVPLPHGVECEKWRKIVKNGWEPLLVAIENNGWTGLDLVLSGDVESINRDITIKMHLLKYMVFQMCRGDRFMRLMNVPLGHLSGESMARIGSYMRALLPICILGNLEEEINSGKFVLLRNGSKSFITGDCPVVNLDGRDPPTSLLLFFPVSPELALLFIPSNADEEYYKKFLDLDDDRVNQLNTMLCGVCVEQVHANDAIILADGGYRPLGENCGERVGVNFASHEKFCGV